MGGQGQAGWPAQVCLSLHADGTKVSESLAPEGMAGYVQHGTRGGVFMDQVAKVARNGSDVIVFFGSRNDLKEPAERVGTAARMAWTKAALMAPSARIIIIGPAWSAGDPPAGLFTLRDQLRDAATQNGFEFVDPLAERWFADNPELIGADGIHPTDDGHRYLARKIQPVVEAALKKTSGIESLADEKLPPPAICGRDTPS